jgi:hypothetical protein
VFTYRSAQPFSATAGIDVNGDASTNDYVPGTKKGSFNSGDNGAMVALVNTWRTLQGPDALHPTGLAAIPQSQLGTNELYQVDMRLTKSFQLTPRKKVEVFGQVFNLLGRTNLGGRSTNALSDSFGLLQTAAAMRQAEVAVRFAW